MNKYQLDEHTAYEAGESPSGKLATKAAGVAVRFGRDFKADHVRCTSTPPAELNGFGFDLRMKTPKFDFVAVVLSYPPRSPSRRTSRNTGPR